MEILWLSLVAIPVLALIALWEHRFSKGEWLKDEPKEWQGVDDDEKCLNCGKYVMPMDICPCSCGCSYCREIMKK